MTAAENYRKPSQRSYLITFIMITALAHLAKPKRTTLGQGINTSVRTATATVLCLTESQIVQKQVGGWPYSVLHTLSKTIHQIQYDPWQLLKLPVFGLCLLSIVVASPDLFRTFCLLQSISSPFPLFPTTSVCLLLYFCTGAWNYLPRPGYYMKSPLSTRNSSCKIEHCHHHTASLSFINSDHNQFVFDSFDRQVQMESQSYFTTDIPITMESIIIDSPELTDGTFDYEDESYFLQTYVPLSSFPTPPPSTSDGGTRPQSSASYQGLSDEDCPLIGKQAIHGPSAIILC